MQRERKEGVVVQSVAKALAVLNCFSGHEEALTVSDISERMGLSPSTAFGLINTLRNEGFLEQDRVGKQYRLGMRMLQLGVLTQQRLPLFRIGEPFCQELLKKRAYTLHLATVVGGEVIYVHKMNNPNSPIMYSHVGKIASKHCTGIGKAVLAFLKEEEIEQYLHAPLERFTPNTITDPNELRKELQRIRERRFAVDDEEVEIGCCCVAAPIFHGGDQVIGAVSISTTRQIWQNENLSELASDVIFCAGQISKRM